MVRAGLLLAVVLCPSMAAAQAFGPGEALSFDVRFLGMRAAELQLRVEDAGEGDLRLLARARTIGTADSLFRMRSQSTCVVGGLELSPKLCRSSLRHRGYDERREVRLDSSARTVTERLLEDGVRQESRLALSEGLEAVHEGLSGLYHLRRSFSSLSGPKIRFRGIREGKLTHVDAEVVGHEQVDAPFGKVSATVVRFRVVELDGEDRVKGGTVWLSDDDRKLPLRMELDAPVGRIEARLTSAEGTLSGQKKGEATGAAPP